eukprot:COSAG02_NODE_37838_length_437_cov_0.538462_1_plen_106_part_01
MNEREVSITRVYETASGTPAAEMISKRHDLKHMGYPRQSPQKGTEQLTASGDRNPKNLVLQGGFIWFSQAVTVDGRSAVQWHQMRLNGAFVQTGLISDPKRSFIQT